MDALASHPRPAPDGGMLVVASAAGMGEVHGADTRAVLPTGPGLAPAVALGGRVQPARGIGQNGAPRREAAARLASQHRRPVGWWAGIRGTSTL